MVYIEIDPRRDEFHMNTSFKPMKTRKRTKRGPGRPPKEGPLYNIGVHLLLNAETYERLQAISRADGLDSKCATVRRLIDREYEKTIKIEKKGKSSK
jgi:hypothetical protein